MIVAVAALTLIVLALLWERRQERASAAVERERAAKEREGLLQRIQAPEVAVAQHASQERPAGLLHVPLDDDAAYWEDRSS